MRSRDRDRHTARDVALVGGAALVAYWLLRGRGPWGAGAAAASASAGAGVTHAPTPPAPRPPCRVWIRESGLEVDGKATDLASAIERCRPPGRAEVRATGSAITRSIMDVLRAFQQAGISIDASPELLHLARISMGAVA